MGYGSKRLRKGAGIMLGRALLRQGLATTCEDPVTDGKTGGAGRGKVWRMSL